MLDCPTLDTNKEGSFTLTLIYMEGVCSVTGHARPRFDWHSVTAGKSEHWVSTLASDLPGVTVMPH